MGLHIRKGDTVQVLAGKDRGKQGRVVNIYPDRDKLMVEGVNQVKRHEKIRPAQGRGGVQGGIIVKEMPVHISNVALICNSCGKPTRIGHNITSEGKERVCRTCGGKI